MAPPVLHCHHYTPFVYGAVAQLLRRRLRLIYTVHGRLEDGPVSQKRRLANRVLAMVPHHVCAVSQDLRRHMVAEGFGRHQVKVVGNGVTPGVLPDVDCRRRVRGVLGIPADSFVVGSVGRLDPVKDLSTLINAFAEPEERGSTRGW